jgi:hypothetical protein
VKYAAIDDLHCGQREIRGPLFGVKQSSVKTDQLRLRGLMTKGCLLRIIATAHRVKLNALDFLG